MELTSGLGLGYMCGANLDFLVASLLPCRELQTGFSVISV